MKQKTRNILKWAPSLLAAAIIIMSASMKLTSQPQLVEAYSRTGILEYMKVLGVAEIIFTTMFLINSTMRVGFLLLTAYFGGAIAVELSHGNIFVFPALILIVVWAAAFLRDPLIFKSSQIERQTLAAQA